MPNADKYRSEQTKDTYEAKKYDSGCAVIAERRIYKQADGKSENRTIRMDDQ